MHLSPAQCLILFLKTESVWLIFDTVIEGVPDETPSKRPILAQNHVSLFLAVYIDFVFLDYKLHVSFHEIPIQAMD